MSITFTHRTPARVGAIAVPGSARFFGTEYDHATGTRLILIEEPSLEEIEPGGEIPLLCSVGPITPRQTDSSQEE